jgi:hypothetical protein
LKKCIGKRRKMIAAFNAQPFIRECHHIKEQEALALDSSLCGDCVSIPIFDFKFRYHSLLLTGISVFWKHPDLFCKMRNPEPPPP